MKCVFFLDIQININVVLYHHIIQRTVKDIDRLKYYIDSYNVNKML